MLVNNLVYDPKYTDFQDLQQAHVAALRDFYTETPMSTNRMSILDFDEVEEPLERSRIRGPFGAEVLVWVRMNPFVKIGIDADGRDYIEY